MIILFFPQAEEKLLLTAIRKEQSFEMLSLSECIPWMIVGLAESVAIVTLNLCTIIVFMRNRNLRKRSTYLVINLAVIDMFVGGPVVFNLFFWPGVHCNLWKWHSIAQGTNISVRQILTSLFPIASLTNITIIALERVHATFYALRHRVLKKWVYRFIIAGVWVISGLLAIVHRDFIASIETYYYGVTVLLTFSSIFPLIICISYTSIIIKVRCGAQPQHHGAARRERKLTMTLLIVTVVSLLLYLPHVIWLFVLYISEHEIERTLSFSVFVHVDFALVFLLYTNSLVNPMLYAIRMPEYRSVVLVLFRKRPQQQREGEVLRLREM